jgi:immune inhibitor A
VRKLITIAAAMTLLLSMAAGSVSAAPDQAKRLNKTDNLPGKLAQKQIKLKEKAQEMVLKGQAKASGPNQVVEVAKGQYVELAFEGEDQILTLLAEFGDDDPTHNHGAPPTGFGDITHTGDAFAHNSIPEPDRSEDNTTIWEADFSQDYYDNLLYNEDQVPSMANYYLEQSGGRYSVDGLVGDWVEVPNNPSAYGSNYCGSIVCTRDIGRFLVDQGNAWYDSLIADGMTPAQIDAMLAPFDVWDRYNYDGDTNFNEPDGYIDHFQSVHAGEGEETGGGALGEDAIWSHRSYANAGVFEDPGPTVGGEVVPFGGYPLGESKYWVGDYTIEPENGGVGVFAHEFAHDLNIPDLYDTSGNTGGAENSTAWWTIMSQGSYGTISDDLGSYPTDFGAWEKFQLGFMRPGEYGVGSTGQNASFKLGPAELTTKHNRALFVVLPDKEVTVEVGDPWSGDWFYHSGAGNDLNNFMYRSFTLPAGTVSATFDARYHIEPCWDYAYMVVSTDAGAHWTNVHTSASDHPDADVNGNNEGEGISGISGTTLACDDDLTPTPDPVENITADLSPWAGQTVLIGFRYETDGATVGDGFGVDNLDITGQPVDDAESDFGWTFDGFVRTDGTVTSLAFNAYVAEYRQYRKYDEALLRGPYNFVDPLATEGLPNWVEHFPYQDGLLISYWDTSFADNNVGDHPGGGLILPIDAHPGILHWSDGSVARPRIQSYDSTFGLWRTDAISLHNLSEDLTLTRSSLPAVRVFNDLNDYWVSGDPGDAADDGRYQAEWASVNTPNTGTQIKILNVSAQGNFMQVEVK